MFKLRTLLVEKLTECPSCGRTLHNGDMIFLDDDRKEAICCYCGDNYKELVISEEGEDGRLLK